MKGANSGYFVAKVALVASIVVASRWAVAQVEYDVQGPPVRQGPAPYSGGSRGPLLDEEQAVALVDFMARHPEAEVTLRPGSSRPSLLCSPAGGLLSPGNAAAPAQAGTAPLSSEDFAAAEALEFVEREAAALGWTGSVGSLAAGAVHSVEGTTVVHLEQRHQGLPVLGHGITVLLEPDGGIVAVLPRMEEGLPELPPPVMDEAAASEAALAELVGRPPLAPVQPSSARLAVTRIGARHHLVWDLRLSTPIGPFRVLVDAASGALLGAGSLLSSVSCSPAPRGTAYAESPAKGAPRTVELPDLDCGKVFLDGEYVRAFQWLGSNPFTYDPIFEFGVRGSKTGAGVVFDASLARDLAQVTIFEHASRFHDWLRGVGFRLLDRPFPAVANALECYGELPCANAFYNPLYEYSTGLGILVFGVGLGVNFGLEADVICHEYTHGVVAATADLGSDFFDPFVFYSLALNEAFADYFSSTFVGDPQVGEYVGRAFGQGPLRDLDNSLRWPDSIDPWSYHDTGSIWGGALWSVRQALGQGGADEAGIALADRLAYTTLLALDSSASFLDAAEALSAATAALRLSPAQALSVKDILVARGLLATSGSPAAEVRRVKPPADLSGEVPALASGNFRLDRVQQEIVVPAHGSRLLLELEGSGNLDLYVRRNSPVTAQGETILATAASEGAGASERIDLQRGGAIELTPGSWFVAIANRSAAVAAYRLKITLETTSFEDILTLSSGDPWSGSVPPGPLLSPRQFSFEVSSATGSELDVTVLADQDVDLYLRRGAPIGLDLEGQVLADIVARSPRAHEEISLDVASIPALTQGTYYLALWNATTVAAQISIEARLVPVEPTLLTEEALPPGALREGTVSAALPGVSRLGDTQYAVLIPEDGARLVVEARSANDVGLFLRRGRRVAFEGAALAFDHSSNLPGAGVETVMVDLFSSPVLKPGVYYIGISNGEALEASFQLTATIETAPVTAVLQDLPSGTWIDVTAEAATAVEPDRLSGKQYRLSVGANAPGLDVLTNPMSAGNIDLYLRRERPVQMIDGRVVADYHAESTIGAESITVFQRDLIPGSYYVGIVNRARAAVSLQLIAVHEGALPLTVLLEETDLFSGAIAAAPNPPTGCRLSVDQFAVEVPANALRFELSVVPTTTGPLQVLARFGGRILINLGAAVFDEQFSTDQGSIVYSGLNLSPGSYYFAIANCQGREQTYELSMRMTIPGAQEARLPDLEVLAESIEGAAPGASGRLHPTQYTLEIGQGVQEVVLSAWGGDCAGEDIDLFVRKGERVTWGEGEATNADWRATRVGPGGEAIILGPTSTPPLVPGKYSVGIVQRSPSRIPFHIVGTRWPVATTPVEDGVETQGVVAAPPRGGGLLELAERRVEVPPGATGLSVSLRPLGNPSQDIDLHVRYAAPVYVGANGTAVADGSSEKVNTGVEAVVLPPAGKCLRPGTYFLAVGNFAPAQVQYILTAEVEGGGTRFLRGDANEDGRASLTDAVVILTYLFSGGAEACLAASDTDNNARVNLTDAVFLLGYLFLGARAPDPPFPVCGLGEPGEAGGATGCADRCAGGA